jgi:transcriptional regulator with XRE-family HTH domain
MLPGLLGVGFEPPEGLRGEHDDLLSASNSNRRKPHFAVKLEAFWAQAGGRMARRTVKPDGGKVSRLRVAKGWTVAFMAAQVGCSERTLENVEKGKPCFVFTLKNVAKALGIESSQLLAEADEPAAVTPKERRFEVQIKVSVAFDQFDECEQLTQFIELLKRAIGASHDIEVKDLKASSVTITLEMSEEDIAKLLVAFQGGQLDDLRVSSITLPRSPDFGLGIEGGPPQLRQPGLSIERDIPREVPAKPEKPAQPLESPPIQAPPRRPPHHLKPQDDDDDDAVTS